MADYLPEARDEILAAADHYESCVPNLGGAFADALDAVVRAVEQAPRSGARVEIRGTKLELRRKPLDRFPYFVVYLVEPAVVVVAVAHMHRRPGYWRTRVV